MSKCTSAQVRKSLQHLLTVFWLFLSLSAYADVQMQIELGFNRHYLADTFVPISVQLENGGPRLRGFLELVQEPEISPGNIFAERYAFRIDLPANSRRLWQLSLPIHAYAATLRVSVCELSPCDATSARISKVIKLYEEYVQEPDKLVLAVSDTPFPKKLPTNESVETIGITQLLEDFAGYAGVRRIYVGKVEARQLTKAQERALQHWLLRGGELVIFSGENWDRQRSRFLEALIPLLALGTSDIHLGDRRLAVVRGEPRGLVLLQEQSVPLLIKRAFGAGTVFLATINPLTSEFPRLWDFLQPPPSTEPQKPPYEFLERLELILPSVWRVGGLVVIFIAGFGLLGLLGIRDKRYLWMLFGWVLLLSAFMMVYMSDPAFSKSLRALEAGIIRASNEETALHQVWYGLFAQKPTALRLRSREAAVQQLVPLKPGYHGFDVYYVYDDEGLQIATQLLARKPRHFYLELSQKVMVRFSTEGGADGQSVRISNMSDFNLKDAVFIKGGEIFCLGKTLKLKDEGRAACLGKIPARTEVIRRLDTPMPDYLQNFPSQDIEDQIKQELLRSAKAGEVQNALVAWSSQEVLIKHPDEEKTVIKLLIFEGSEEE